MIACRKYPYKSRREAQTTSQFRTELPFGKPYRCKICGYWHLGHKNKIPRKSPLAKILRRKAVERRHMRRLFQAIDEMYGVR